MARIILVLAGMVMLSVVAGCATLSKAQCEAGDWRGLGVADGNRGYPMSYLDDHISACADHGISVNRQLYELGRNEGLLSYCRLDRAESEGRAGRTNFNVCHGDFGVSFNRVYDEARDIYKTQKELEVARNGMDSLLEQITTAGLSDAERANLKIEISTQQSQINVLEDRLRLEERELQFALTEERARLSRG